MATTYTRRISLYINGQEVKNDIASIKSEMNKLTAQQARMTRGSEEYVQAAAKIKIMRGIIQEHNNDLKGTTSLWDKLGKAGDNFNRYFAMFAAFAAGFGGLLFAGKKAISTFAEFDDKVGDVMKTTGLAKDRVYAMNEELKKMNTRTAQNELLDLGKVAGKLGLSAEKDVMGFIRAADKINVALKEDLGGDTEQAINEVGKLVDIFKVKEKFGIEDSMLKVGSSINALGAASTANEGYIVEFTKRVAGIAPSAGVNIQAVMGLAATLDQLGQTSEVSSTVYSAVMTGMFKDTAMYAKIAGMSVKDFSGLLKKDANEAFIQFLNGLQGNSGGMEELTAKMDGLGLEGKRSIAVLGVLANNTDILRESQKLSNVEFDKGTSLTNEFNTKNETAQAKLDKASKSLSNMTVELGQKLLPVLTVSTSGMGYFVKAVGVITDFLIKHSKAILIVSSAMGAYIVRQQALVLWENIKNISLGKGLIITNLQAIAARAQIVLTGEATIAQKRAIIAQNQMNAAMMRVPWGLILAGVAAAVAAYAQYKNGLNAVTRAKSEFYLSLVNEQQSMRNLFETVKTTAQGSKERAEGIKKINEVYGQYLPNLLTEKSSLDDITEAQIAANKALVDSSVLKFKQKETEEIMNKSLEKQKSALGTIMNLVKDAKGASTSDAFVPIFNQYMDEIGNSSLFDKAVNDKTKKLADFYGIDILLFKANVDEIRKAKNQQENDLKSLDSVSGLIYNKDKLLGKEEKISQLRIALSRAETKEDKKNIQEQIDILEKRNKAKSGDAKTNDGKSLGFTPDSKKNWSLNSDLAFMQAKAKLNDQFAKGAIATQEELDKQLLAIEILYLDKRIKTGKESGEELAKLKADLSDKEVKQRLDDMKREKELLEASKEGMSDVDKERFAYDQRLIDLKLFGKNQSDMTVLEQKAFLSLQKAHQDKMNKLDAEAITKGMEKKQTAFNAEFEALRAIHANELNSITSFAQAKAILAETMSADDLKKIKTLEQAKKAIEKQQQNEEIKIQTDYLKDLEKQLSDAMQSGTFEGINLSDTLLSDEEIEALQDKINEVKKILGGLKTNSLDGAGEQAGAKDARTASFHDANKTDILGFSTDDWESLYANLEQGKIGVNEISMAATVLMDTWKTYNDFLTASENKQLKKYEKSTNEKKAKLQEQLDSGIISQESYNAQVKALDADLDAKKEEIANKQAKRDAAMAMASIIQNTAAGIMQLWVKPGFPAAIPLAVMVGAMGALQLATVAASYSGAEEGGFINVVRSQDGKRFNAKNDPAKRGYVSTPTVITGENGTEWIAPAEAVGNPTIRPILDILEMSRQAGNLATLNLGAVMGATTLSGRSGGGSVTSTNSVYENASGTSAFRLRSASGGGSDIEMVDVLLKVSKVVENLQKKLDDPIKTYVNIHGTTGLARKLDEYYSLGKNADI